MSRIQKKRGKQTKKLLIESIAVPGLPSISRDHKLIALNIMSINRRKDQL